MGDAYPMTPADSTAKLGHRARLHVDLTQVWNGTLSMSEQRSLIARMTASPVSFPACAGAASLATIWSTSMRRTFAARLVVTTIELPRSASDRSTTSVTSSEGRKLFDVAEALTQTHQLFAGAADPPRTKPHPAGLDD